MADQAASAEPRSPAVAIVGLACRFPDANDAPELLDVVLTGRRAFRRVPPARFDIADYYQPGRSVPDATYSTRAALLENWKFDCGAFGVDKAGYAAADPAMWLALETAARALAGAGLTSGTGINQDRTGVIVGNSLGGDISRANALRLRWPFVRRVLTDALAGVVPAENANAVLRRAERRYLSPFPVPGTDTLAGSMPGSIATAISRHFGFRGASHAVDSASSSSLQAVASACSSLMAGELDAAVVGGVEVSLDPLELIGLAKTGALATSDVRIYDEDPSGYLPAEGCGMVVLMRTADARSAGLPVYAEIVGWGASAGGSPGEAATGVSSQLLAMRRAYERAGLDPVDVQLFEGNGAATKEDDEAELIALEVLRAGAHQDAALGSVKANIGHANAAAGVAGLIKAVLSLSTGVLPPATGVGRPHALISGGAARLKLPSSVQEWPAGTRHAGVSALDSAGSNVHLVLRTEPAAPYRKGSLAPAHALSTRSLEGEAVTPRLMTGPGEPIAFMLRGADRFALVAVLSRLADIACWLSDAELQDLACTLAREPDQRGTARVGLVAADQDQLAALASQAVALLPSLADGVLSIRPGIFAADKADGRIALLLSGESAVPPENLTSSVTSCLDALRWLESLEVHAAVAVGHELGALAGLAWAGVLGEGDVADIAELRAQFLDRSAAGPSDADAPEDGADAATPAKAIPAVAGRANSAKLRAAIAQKFRLGPPRRRLISTLTGAEVESVDAAIDLICSGFSGDGNLSQAIAMSALEATLLLETGPGSALTTIAADAGKVPAVSLDAGPADSASSAKAAAALFAAGALSHPQSVFAGWPARPIDIWRERAFIASPCELRPKLPVTAAAPPLLVPPQRTAEVAEDEAALPGPGTTAPASSPEAALAAEEPAAGAAIPEPAADDNPANSGAPDIEEQAEEQVAEEQVAEEQAEVQAAGADANGTQPDDGGRKVSEDREGLSGLREEFERRLPHRPMTVAAHSSVVADRDEAPLADHGLLSSPAIDQLTALGTWASCFGEALRPADYPPRSGDELSWRTVVAGPRVVRTAALRAFRAQSAAPRTLAVLGDPTDEDSRAAGLQAARDAINTGCLVVVTTSPDFTGFFASVQAEHPGLGVTVLRIPGTENGPKLASRFAYAEPGTFRELVIGADGSVCEPVMDEVELTSGGTFPLGPEDVVLVSRGARGAGLALAQVLACCGTPVAVIGRATDSDDSALVAGLEQLRSAGARIGYEVIDIANPASLAAAIERVEARLGPVTAIGHAAGSGDPVPLVNLTDAAINDHIASDTATLDRLVGSIRPGQLRLIVTFGSVAGRYGVAGGTLLALSSAALAGRSEQLAAATDNCRRLHIDMPSWSAGGLGDRPELAEEIAAAGAAPIDVGVASRLLLKVMTTTGLPDRLAVHGRVSGPAARTARALDAADLAAAGLPGGARFLQDVEVYYPGIELVCEPRLSLRTDPYLADYRVDGLPVLPPVLALEALAQAASVLAGRPARTASNVRLDSPIVVPMGSAAELRIWAQRTGDTITAVLRSRDSSFAVDHARAEFSCAGPADEMPPAEIASTPAALSQLSAGPSGLVDGAELYGPISFQSGRFRRVALLPEVSARSCRALARGDDELPWFDPEGPHGDSGFVLGSPGLNDATLHAVQACVPHRRMRPASCESVVFSGRVAAGPVEIRAVATLPVQAGPTAPSLEPVPETAPVAEPETAGAAEVATASRGFEPGVEMTEEELADQQPAQSRPQSKRVRKAMRKHSAGQQRHAMPDQATARAARPNGSQANGSQANGTPERIEAGPADDAGRTEDASREDASRDEAARAEAGTTDSVQFGSMPSLLADQRWNIEAVDSSGQLLVTWRGAQLRDAGPLPRNAAWPPSLLSVYLERASCELGLDSALRVAVSCGQPEAPGPQFLATAVPRQAPPAGATDGARDASPPAATMNVAVAHGSGPLAGFSLTASALAPVACGWSTAEPGPRHDPLAGSMASAYSQLRSMLAESPTILAARLRAISACVVMAGCSPTEQASCTRTTNEGWALVELPAARVACAVVELSGVSSPVAVAILTGHAPSGGVRRQAVARQFGEAAEAPDVRTPVATSSRA